MIAYAYNAQASFGRSTADAEIERRAASMAAAIPLEWSLCAFEDGVLAAKLCTLPFIIHWNRREIGCGGVAGVTTLPTHRRRGHLRELMTRAFATMRDSGQPLAMLWASMAAIYQRFGYAAAIDWTYRFNPRNLRFVDEIATPGRVRLVRSDDAVPFIAEPYERFAGMRTLMLQRNITVESGQDWWTTGSPLRRWRPEEPPYLVAVYEEERQVLGYVIYDVTQHDDWQPGPDQELLVSDLVWLTPAAHRALIRYLAGYDLVRTIRLTHVPVDDPLFYHAQEPRLLGARAEDGALLRIVDLKAALEGRGYDADGRLVLALHDELCPWNSGVWELWVEGSTARVCRSDAEPALWVAPRALAMLASGCQSATMLARIGLLPATDQRVLATADAIFRTACAPLCLDHF